MDIMSLIYYIRKVLPGIDINSVRVQELPAPTETVINNVLSKYFQEKRSRCTASDNEILLQEASYINKLYPTLTLDYIIEQLQIFKDMLNRTEIVLRMIHWQMSKNGEDNPVAIKRNNPNMPPNYDIHPSKIRKVSEEPIDLTSSEIMNRENPALKEEYPENNAVPNVKNEEENVQLHTNLELISPNAEVQDEKLAEPETTTLEYLFQQPDVGNTIKEESLDANVQVKQIKQLSSESNPRSNSPLKINVIKLTKEHSAYLDEQLFGKNQKINYLGKVPGSIKVIKLDKRTSATIINDNNIQEQNISTNLKSKEENGNDEQYSNAPSTSKQENNKTSGTNENFNLVDYLHEITKAPRYLILKHCRKLNLSIRRKPSVPVLLKIIDGILENEISSDSSDNDEYEANFVRTIATTVTTGTPENAAFAEIEVSDSLNENPIIQTNSFDPGNLETENNLNPESFSPPMSSNNVGYLQNNESNKGVNTQLVTYLCSMFSDADPDYIKKLCRNKEMNSMVVDELTTIILSCDNRYPKRRQKTPEPEVVPENQFEILREFLPDADPDYLRMMCDRFEGKPEQVKIFLNEAMERKNYPTLKEYQRQQQLSAQQKQYTSEFSVENFIKLIPDPDSFFSDPSRVIKMDALSSHYAIVFLRNTFNKLPVRLIQQTFTKNDCKLYKTVQDLKAASQKSQILMKSTRKRMEMPNNIQNIPLLQEIAYFTHEAEIKAYLEESKTKELEEIEEARNQGLFKTCNCCFDEEVLPKNIFCCENGCSFCKACIVKSTEVRFGEGKLDFPCLSNCSSAFTLQTLQSVLSPKLFSKIAQKKALEEVKAAGIEELETCPFCDFATIPAEGYSIFSCFNPECMKESCRSCKQPSHIPLRCEEIERDEDVRARTYVENKMTEALLKKCWKCGIKFFKEEGCNKMTCSCGAQMCYVCGKPVTDYRHFNGNGGDRFDLCPLYSDTNVLNKENVLRGAEEAKAEIGNKNLKHDPTKDVQQHYNERGAKLPKEFVVNNNMPGGPAWIRLAREIERRNHQRPF